MLAAIFIIVAILIVYAVTLKKIHSKDDQQQEWTEIQGHSETRGHSEGSWRENNADGSFRIYNKTGSSTVMKVYSGGERYIDGRPVNSSDDMERWYVMKGLSEGYERRLSEIEYMLEKSNIDNGDELLKEWKERYQAYRKICTDHNITSNTIVDHGQIEILYEKWKSRMAENQIILDYLEYCPRKHSLKDTLINDLSGGNPAKKQRIQTIYRRLISAGVIAEKENAEGKMETRIIVRRNKGPNAVKPLPASTYHPDIYSHVRKKDIYKVYYSVNPPENLNPETNTCQFTSKSSGTVYSTSLEKCTCPAYTKGYACKHMLALAIQLGYYNRSDARS